MEKEIFKNKKVNIKKLIEYGFIKKEDAYIYATPILNNQFELRIQIANDGKIKTELIEYSTQYEYILHLTDATGEFVGKIRNEYEKVLLDIANNCYDKNIFKSNQAIDIIKYISKTYGDELEYLWQKFPNNAIWRRKDTKKWYAALLIITKSKLNIGGDELIEIIDLRAEENKINDLIDNKKIYPGYHMNKKHWITICLDDSVRTSEIIKLINDSYLIAK